MEGSGRQARVEEGAVVLLEDGSGTPMIGEVLQIVREPFGPPVSNPPTIEAHGPVAEVKLEHDEDPIWVSLASLEPVDISQSARARGVM